MQYPSKFVPTRGGLPRARSACPLLILLIAPTFVAVGAPKTDVVVFENGDRLTGEVKRLDRGQRQLQYADVQESGSTDDAAVADRHWWSGSCDRRGTLDRAQAGRVVAAGTPGTRRLDIRVPDAQPSANVTSQ
jgi:hypothetical protein